MSEKNLEKSAQEEVSLQQEQPSPVIEQPPVSEPIVLEVDAVLLVDAFLKDKEVSDEDSLNLELFLKGDVSGWRFKNIPAPSLEELKILEPQVSQKQKQEQISKEALQFLNETDKWVTRHRDQLELGIQTKLSAEEFAQLLKDRQAARDRI